MQRQHSIRIIMALSVPQHGSCECSYTCGNRRHSVDDLRVPSFQNPLDCLRLPWNETSPEQGYPNPSVDHTLLQNEEDDKEEEDETGHDEKFVHSVRLLECDYELF